MENKIFKGSQVKVFVSLERLSDGVEGFWDCVSQAFIEPIS